MDKLDQKPGAGAPDIPRATLDIRDFAIYLLLVISTLAAYSQVRSYDFVAYDDPEYVTANPIVRSGLTLHGLTWAFTTDRDGNWFPLTWLSHMADSQFFGQRSGLHHLTNVLLHMLSALILFALLKRMTGSRWRSAVVAALFALHPLHVESVAWVAERKDVLSGLFWMLTLLGYAHYVERPRPGRYLLVVIPFCLGLMSKPMIITLPFVLLLLDVWPLRRLSIKKTPPAGRTKKKGQSGMEPKVKTAGILWEKAPLFALSACSAAVTYVVQQRGGALVSTDWIPLGTRIANALVSYVVYVWQAFWPARLVVFYPHPISLPAWESVGAGLVLVGVSILVLRSLPRLPYLAVGWFWYLGTLVPVIGLVQVGMQSRADRYTYMPLVGIFLLLTWGVADIFKRWPTAKPALGAMAVAACCACLILTWVQVQNWRNSATLFTHAVVASTDNYLGYYGLGGVLRDQGRLDDAATFYGEAMRLYPRFAGAHSGLAGVYLKQGRINEAITELTEAIRLSPATPEDRISLGIALNKLGKGADAAAELLEAIRLEPDSADAHYNLGIVYAGMRQTDDAKAQFDLAVRLEPDRPETHYNLGNALAVQGKMTEAIAEFTMALQLRPNYGNAHNNLGSALANMGRIDEAITHFSEAVRLMPESEEARRNLEYATSLQSKPIKK
jgi:tetratricopeptide (TPR) repeat protein